MARKRQDIEHENHERWLVSYADFITLLFAFFVVMYAISQVNEGKYRVLSQALVQAFANPQQVPSIDPALVASSPTPVIKPIVKPVTPTPAPMDDNHPEARKMKGIAREISRVLDPLVKEGQVKVTQSRRGVAVEINAAILFPPAQANLQAESMRTLAAVAEAMSAAENRIMVEGFTDSTPIASAQFPSNWELSGARAASVVRLFIDHGVKAERMAAIGHGENRALADNLSPEGRAKNRRVAITILTDAKDDVRVLPLED